MRKRGWKELRKRVDVQPSLVNRYWKEHDAICECIGKGKTKYGDPFPRLKIAVEKDLEPEIQSKINFRRKK
jgi:hypothetical protein